jgi:UDP-N-acetylmuramate dehydrogenase
VRRGIVEEYVPLAPLTTYKLGGPARWLAEPRTEKELVEVTDALRRSPCDVLVLGRGSNLLIADGGFDGLVIRLGRDFSYVSFDKGDVVAGAATSLPVLARTAVRRGRGGLEFFVGIPGSVGGAIRMNAGCHGAETADVLNSARILDLDRVAVEERSPARLELSYRHSNLTEREIVLSATFATIEADTAEAEDTMREISRWRKEHQPGGTLNAGSVFKNPPGDAAGRIIDEAGLKGYRLGAVAVSEKHANFIVADEGATADDVHRLIVTVRSIVAERIGVDLEPEIRFAGEFRRS